MDVSGLVKRFGSTTAVDGLDLRLAHGQVLALLGPNGAGKTTTVEICEGFLRRDAGSVRVLGLDPATDNERLRPRIGVMPQGGGAYPGVRAEEMLALVAACAANPIDPAWLIDVLGLARRGGRRTSGSPAASSNGCRSRARSSAGRSWCSSTSRRPGWTRRRGGWCGSWWRRCARTACRVLLTTHAMEEAEELADQVVIIDRGRVVAEGSPRQLTAEQAGRRAAALPRAPGLDTTQLCAALPDGCHIDEPTPGRVPAVGQGRPAGGVDGDRVVRAAGRAGRGAARRPAQPRGRLPRPDRTGTALMTTFPAGTFTPAPGRGRVGHMLAVHARTEAMLTLRNSEQVLLTLLIPLALLIGLTELDVFAVPEPRVDSVAPRIFALAVMSSAFTGQAIALGFDRRYGVLKRLAATALPRWLLVGGRAIAGLVVVVRAARRARGSWPRCSAGRRRSAGVGWAVLLVVLGTLSFGALGVLLGGALKAEVVLALANIVWFVLLLAGGIAVPAALDARRAGRRRRAAAVRRAGRGHADRARRRRRRRPGRRSPCSLGWGAVAGAARRPHHQALLRPDQGAAPSLPTIGRCRSTR